MVRFRLHKSLLLLFVISVSAALLVRLGILQYRWLGQISETEQERRRAALRLAASRFSEDFDRELARAFVTFQLDSETLRRRKWENYSTRYDLWLSQSPFPQLISEIYLLTSEWKDRIRAARYDHGARRFESIEAPACLEDLCRRIELRQNAFRAGGNFSLPAIDPVDGHLPALVIPLLQVQLIPQSRSRSTVLKEVGKIEEVGKLEKVGAESGDYVVVMLNQDLIRQAIIPLLARRHFSDPSGQGEMDYNLIITSQRSPRIQIYSSAQKAPDEDPQTSDATVGLFSLRPDWTTNFASGAGTVGNHEIIQPRIFVAHGSTPRRATAASGEIFSSLEISGSAASSEQRNPVVIPGPIPSSNGDPPEWRLSLIPSNGDQSEWRLSLRHRAGSLETAVSQLQRRNLLVSFGVLALLAVNMALIIIASQRERRLARQQMEFVAGVSHELRSPVSAVCLASANLADGLVQGHQRVKDYGVMINREGRRLAVAVEQALDFAGTEFIKKPYHFRPLAASELVERALAAIKSQADEMKFEIEKEFDAELPAAMADGAAIERAVYNLLGNAIKYSGHVRRLKLILQAVDREVRITVEDYGLGIAASDLPHIFEPFYRGRAAVESNIQGNGLGLCLVERIAKAHGGKVSVKSAVGQGSRFTLHLPAIIDKSEAVQKNSRGEHEQSSVVG